MRGKPGYMVYTENGVRITPAHAGKTNKLYVFFMGKQDHPRACGENLFRIHTHGSGQGSPPRMRGKR